jgi:hypothetical protein
MKCRCGRSARTATFWPASPPRPDANQAAGSRAAYQRLLPWISASPVRRVLPRVGGGDAGKPLPAGYRLGQDQDRPPERRGSRDTRGPHRLIVDCGFAKNTNTEHRPRVDHGRARGERVRLQHDEPADDERRRGKERQQQAAEVVEVPPPPREHRRAERDQRELRELRWLDCDGTERDPSRGASRHRSGGGMQDQHQQEHVMPRGTGRESLPDGVTHPRCEQERTESHGRRTRPAA